MHDKTWSMFKRFMREHIKVVQTMAQARTFATQAQCEGDLCDTVYALRQSVLLAKRSAKLMEDAAKSIERLVVIQWVKENMNNLAKAQPIRGDVSIGSPHTGFAMTTPKKDTPEYKELCEYLGFTGHTVEEGIATFHWPRLMEHCNQRIAEGKPMPPGMHHVSKAPTYELKPLRKRGDSLRDRAAAEMGLLREEIDSLPEK